MYYIGYVFWASGKLVPGVREEKIGKSWSGVIRRNWGQNVLSVSLPHLYVNSSPCHTSAIPTLRSILHSLRAYRRGERAKETKQNIVAEHVPNAIETITHCIHCMGWGYKWGRLGERELSGTMEWKFILFSRKGIIIIIHNMCEECENEDFFQWGDFMPIEKARGKFQVKKVQHCGHQAECDCGQCW